MQSFDNIRLSHGDGLDQPTLDALIRELQPRKSQLRPLDKDEPLPLVDGQGKPLGTWAPRWVCHFLGLRHCCAQVFLLWESPALGQTLVLQVRAWDKDDSPGHLDISAAGHVTTEASNVEQAAFKEMLEETGLQADDLDGSLQRVGGLAHDDPARPEEQFWNSEWREIFLGNINQDRLGTIRFQDGEVSGLVLIPVWEARALFRQQTLSLASGLRYSLPRLLGWLALRRLFSFFREVRVSGVEGLVDILEMPLCSTACLYEEEDGLNTFFTDTEEITYFYDFSAVDLAGLDRWQLENYCVTMARGSDLRSVRSQLEKLHEDGKKVTHVVRSLEEYGGGTHDSVWREHLKAEIVEIGKEF